MNKPQALVKNQFNLTLANHANKTVLVKDERSGSMSTTTLPAADGAAGYFARQRAALERQIERLNVLEEFTEEYYRSL